MPYSLDYSLSEELIDRIISFVSPKSSLKSLCLTSKKLNRIASAYLYAEVFFHHNNADEGLRYLLPVSYLLWTSPAHAALVRSFAVRTISDPESIGEYKSRWPQKPDLDETLRAKCDEAAKTKDEAEEWYEVLKQGADEELVISLLLPYLPNLQKLDLSMAMFKENQYLLDLFERIGRREKPFDKIPASPKLEPSPNLGDMGMFSSPLDALLTGDDDKYPNSPVYFGAAFNLPNLRRVYGWRLGENEQDEPSTPMTHLKPSSCPVEYIEARTSKFHPEDLSLMLKACIPGKLKTLNYEIGCTWAWVNVNHAEINAALKPHYKTLEALGLSHEDFYPYQFDNDLEKPTPMSFTHFSALKKLKVAPVYIWGHDGLEKPEELKDGKHMLHRALPSSLEQLWIARVDPKEGGCKDDFIADYIIPALDLVVQYQSERFPKLKEIRVELPLMDWKDEWIDALVDFVAVAEARGISCILLITELGASDRRYDSDRGWGWDEEVIFKECIHNQELPKIWLKTSEHEDLRAKFKELREWHEKEKEEGEKRRKQMEEEYQRQRKEREEEMKRARELCIDYENKEEKRPRDDELLSDHETDENYFPGEESTEQREEE